MQLLVRTPVVGCSATPRVLARRALTSTTNPSRSSFRLPLAYSTPRLTTLRHARLYATGKLDLPALDRKWRESWASSQPKPPSDTADARFVLPMFPYPSGNLHLGHLRVYTIADVVARFQRLQGSDVLLTMGWDAFGLPAENAALARGLPPAGWTKDNIRKMKDQLEHMNGSWDWSRVCGFVQPFPFCAHGS